MSVRYVLDLESNQTLWMDPVQTIPYPQGTIIRVMSDPTREEVQDRYQVVGSAVDYPALPQGTQLVYPLVIRTQVIKI